LFIKAFLSIALIVLIATFQTFKCEASPQKHVPLLVLQERVDGLINDWSGPAKFVLYDDGTVIWDKSNEMSNNGNNEPHYSTCKLTASQVDAFLKPLPLADTFQNDNQQYGQGEDLSWRLVYWQNGKAKRMTIIQTLNNAPADVRTIVDALDKYNNSGSPYTDYSFLLLLGPAPGMKAIPWPFSQKRYTCRLICCHLLIRQPK
jgi:hypothetical protein